MCAQNGICTYSDSGRSALRQSRDALQVGPSRMAWVGGTDYKYFQYDHVTSRRQIGSTFKPFIYSKAIENGFTSQLTNKVTPMPLTC